MGDQTVTEQIRRMVCLFEMIVLFGSVNPYVVFLDLDLGRRETISVVNLIF